MVGVVSYGFGCATNGFAGKHIFGSLKYHCQQSHQFFLLNFHRHNLATNSLFYSGVYARVTNYMNWIQSNIAVRILGAWGKNLRLTDGYTLDKKVWGKQNWNQMKGKKEKKHLRKLEEHFLILHVHHLCGHMIIWLTKYSLTPPSCSPLPWCCRPLWCTLSVHSTHLC